MEAVAALGDAAVVNAVPVVEEHGIAGLSVFRCLEDRHLQMRGGVADGGGVVQEVGARVLAQRIGRCLVRPPEEPRAIPARRARCAPDEPIPLVLTHGGKHPQTESSALRQRGCGRCHGCGSRSECEGAGERR